MATTSPPATTTTSSPETDDSPKSDGRGPRIKHVCRKAAVVLGKPVAKFPKSPEITLSALPSGEKVKLWKKDQLEKKGKKQNKCHANIKYHSFLIFRLCIWNTLA